MNPPAGWTRSSYCSGGACIEIAHAGDRVHVRDSKLGDASPVVGYPPTAWRAFVAGIAAGDFEATR